MLRGREQTPWIVPLREPITGNNEADPATDSIPP
jgi:hypothetical protein